MPNPEIWFAIPSACPDRARLRLPVWRDMGYKIAVLQNRHRADDIPADRILWSDHYPGWAESVNILARAVVPPSAPIVVTGGDDMLPDPATPAHAIAQQFLARFPDTFGVMQPTGDAALNASEYCGSPWLGREWINAAYRGRGPLWPEYRHNWADHELRCVSDALGALWDRPDLSQPHEHFTLDGSQPPPFWREAVEQHDRADVERFIARLWLGFPDHEPRGRPERIDAPALRAAYSGIAERYWATRYARHLLSGDADNAMTRALEACAAEGLDPVAIYGAGTQTRAACASLMAPPVRIACLIDDDPRLRGRSLWGYPILNPEEASSLGLRAVILASRAMTDQLARRAAPLRAAGARIIPLHQNSPHHATPEPAHA